MRSVFYVLSAIMVISLAFWAYRENYQTQEAQARSVDLQRQISESRQRLRVLNAEWAYLNRPDRLRDLAEINFDRLGLLPLQPSQFGKIDQVSYPAPDPLPITNAIDVINIEPQEDGE